MLTIAPTNNGLAFLAEISNRSNVLCSQGLMPPNQRPSSGAVPVAISTQQGDQSHVLHPLPFLSQAQLGVLDPFRRNYSVELHLEEGGAAGAVPAASSRQRRRRRCRRRPGPRTEVEGPRLMVAGGAG